MTDFNCYFVYLEAFILGLVASNIERYVCKKKNKIKKSVERSFLYVNGSIL